MKTVLAIILILGFMPTAFSKQRSCKGEYQKVSCKAVKTAKRNGFCWKGKISEDKIEKICSKERKKSVRKRS